MGVKTYLQTGKAISTREESRSLFESFYEVLTLDLWRQRGDDGAPPKKRVELLETVSRMVVARGWVGGGNRERLVKGPNFQLSEE